MTFRLSSVVIGINWDTDRPTTEYVMDLLACLGKRLYIKDVSSKSFRRMSLASYILTDSHRLCIQVLSVVVQY